MSKLKKYENTVRTECYVCGAESHEWVQITNKKDITLSIPFCHEHHELADQLRDKLFEKGMGEL